MRWPFTRKEEPNLTVDQSDNKRTRLGDRYGRWIELYTRAYSRGQFNQMSSEERSELVRLTNIAEGRPELEGIE